MVDRVKVLIVERNDVDLDSQEELELTALTSKTGLQRSVVTVAGGDVLPLYYGDLCSMAGMPFRRVEQ